ncbi:MAG: DUF1735 domain-containing protein [Alistipes finegoldii]
MTDNIYYQITKPAAEGLALEIWVDNSLLEGFNQANETEYELLPEANCEFPDGKTLTVAKEGLRTDPKRIKVSAEGLEPGEYLLPVSVADKNAADVDERQVLYYTITIRQPQLETMNFTTARTCSLFSTSTHRSTSLFWWMIISCRKSWPADRPSNGIAPSAISSTCVPSGSITKRKPDAPNSASARICVMFWTIT